MIDYFDRHLVKVSMKKLDMLKKQDEPDKTTNRTAKKQYCYRADQEKITIPRCEQKTPDIVIYLSF